MPMPNVLIPGLPLTVADEAVYEALPPDVRAVCDRIIADRVEREVEERYRAWTEDSEDYHDGYRAGRADALRAQAATAVKSAS